MSRQRREWGRAEFQAKGKACEISVEGRISGCQVKAREVNTDENIHV